MTKQEIKKLIRSLFILGDIEPSLKDLFGSEKFIDDDGSKQSVTSFVLFDIFSNQSDEFKSASVFFNDRNFKSKVVDRLLDKFIVRRRNILSIFGAKTKLDLYQKSNVLNYALQYYSLQTPPLMPLEIKVIKKLISLTDDLNLKDENKNSVFDLVKNEELVKLLKEAGK